MRPLVALLSALALACTTDGKAPPDVLRGSVTVGREVRTFALTAPASALAARAAPLLLAFHGTGESGATMRSRAGLDAVATREGWFVAYPDAPAGNWAEGCDCTRADRLGIDDVGFVRALIDSLSSRLPVDRARVFAAGYSQGGLFVHRLACELAGRLAAVASVAAPMSAVLAPRCAPPAPVSVLVAQGTLDDAFPYEGRGRGERAVLGARATARFWRTVNRCDARRTTTTVPDTAADRTRVLVERWSGCARGRTVALVTVEGGRHAWALSRDRSTAEILAEFFRDAACTRGAEGCEPNVLRR